MQARANRANGTIAEPRRFLVTQFFQFTQYDRFAELRGKLEHSGADEFRALLLLGPVRRSKTIDGRDATMCAIGVWLIERKLAWSAFQVLHHAIARDAKQVGRDRSASGII